jgi:hypothetical protein
MENDEAMSVINSLDDNWVAGAHKKPWTIGMETPRCENSFGNGGSPVRGK